ncbi:MAG: hypothetical protein A2806_03290 [Candidatus Terrybacteria bacterium RIFCSPHIGHO2_01_FULL_48_17]|uniref:Uncharacterized protein n=1 Tax=Candidatus Terrybacteria bacterium RIFCSPHIGHO2_01_FULL_48_17 TaxID=1802362 RepID=A0A1G2PGZ0_9BACT|nr:MAG: hypothetical protein A2806_03290 [Candidatus Terrybacteria bacterium RIFCSPHIGHO2_01_FULL_48_17]OHA53145.1 MAG: hypothetical protein A3A30_02170 [Candidatus Terrybacteria bacterium RIFCSPLOWO2_01_FULL_48_14]
MHTKRIPYWIWSFAAIGALILAVGMIAWSLLQAREAIQKAAEIPPETSLPSQGFDRQGFEELLPRLQRTDQ